MNEEKPRSLKVILKTIIHEINTDTYLLMEYLTPIVNGCKAAFDVTVEEAEKLHQLDEEQISSRIQAVSASYSSKSFCFKATDSDDEFSIVFSRGYCKLYNECTDADAVIVGPYDLLADLMNPDAKVSPFENLGESYDIHGTDVHSVVEAIGLLTFPILLKMARDGIDPSSLLAEDADSVITMAASDMITKMIQKWVDLRLKIKKV